MAGIREEKRRSLEEMRARIERYRRNAEDRTEDYTIGCILLEQPFFLPEPLWVPVPTDWSPNIVRGKGYDLIREPGRSMWDRVAAAMSPQAATATHAREPEPRYGETVPVRPRLGQGTFRVMVTDAYQRRCAVTRSRTLPVLEAAHIQSYAEGGEHRVDNGLLLRSDLHTLFDRGYVTVTPACRLTRRNHRSQFDFI